MEGKESEKKKMVVSKPTPCRPSIASAFMREQDPEPDCRSFSQLLAGAMAASSSPPPVGNGVTVRPKTVRLKSIPPPQITTNQVCSGFAFVFLIYGGFVKVDLYWFFLIYLFLFL